MMLLRNRVIMVYRVTVLGPRRSTDTRGEQKQICQQNQKADIRRHHQLKQTQITKMIQMGGLS